MNINAFGTDNFLRFQIRNRMRQIKADDKVIQQEGIESLTIQELSAACQSRGIRSIGTSPGRLRDELAQWLDLHLNHHVPSTLLILSRAFSYTDRGMTTEEALKATFNSLPDNLVNEAELQVLEQVGASTYKQKLDVLEQQQELIEDESEQEEKEAKARQEQEEEEQRRLEEKERETAEKQDAFVPDEPQVKVMTVISIGQKCINMLCVDRMVRNSRNLLKHLQQRKPRRKHQLPRRRRRKHPCLRNNRANSKKHWPNYVQRWMSWKSVLSSMRLRFSMKTTRM
jgi:hypothetical protein